MIDTIPEDAPWATGMGDVLAKHDAVVGVMNSDLVVPQEPTWMQPAQTRHRVDEAGGMDSPTRTIHEPLELGVPDSTAVRKADDIKPPLMNEVPPDELRNQVRLVPPADWEHDVAVFGMKPVVVLDEDDFKSGAVL